MDLIPAMQAPKQVEPFLDLEATVDESLLTAIEKAWRLMRTSRNHFKTKHDYETAGPVMTFEQVNNHLREDGLSIGRKLYDKITAEIDADIEREIKAKRRPLSP